MTIISNPIATVEAVILGDEAANCIDNVAPIDSCPYHEDSIEALAYIAGFWRRKFYLEQNKHNQK